MGHFPTLNIQTLLIFLHLFLSAATTSNKPPYTPTDLVLLNCGASSDSASIDGRIWNSDFLSKFLPSTSQSSSSSISFASHQDYSVPSVPYTTARLFLSQFTYYFSVLPGPKFIRLYFYPNTYSGFNSSTSFFAVKANGYTLVSNFSAYLTVSALSPPVSFIVKEFIVTVQENQVLNITFTPSPNSFAFINGIEIVSMPANLYIKNMDNPYTLVDAHTFFYFHNTTSLETVYRLNVGGGLISSVNDTGMFRTWFDDYDYIFSAASGLVHQSIDVKIKYTNDTPVYVAPANVYITKRTMGENPQVNMNYNLTWLFPVDSGFYYLVRLHFCETEKEVELVNQRVFFIFINNMTAEADADVIHWSGGRYIPSYKDYVVWVPEESNSKQYLWLALHPNLNTASAYADAILNGLEIFKLNKSDGSLASPSPEIVAVPTTDQLLSTFGRRAKYKRPTVVASILGAVTGALLTFCLIFYVLFYKCRRQAWKSFSWVAFSYTSRHGRSKISSLPTELCRLFTILEINEATANFDDQKVIGSGGFGKVYVGYIKSGSLPVAIKRLDSSSKQGIREFKTEIEMLSQLRHVNLVSLIGYCVDEGEMILVYDYMTNGTLREHLYDTYNDPLPWKKRLEICIGAARGLHYLHTGLSHTIIHRDVKTTNILLDEKCVAKISDFGLSKIGLNNNGVSTVVKGTWGYLDPEYARFQQLTEKSDVYSFGVVLFEILCARKPVHQNSEYEKMNLVNWAGKSIQNETIYEIIDPYLMAKIAPECFNKYVEIAESCVRNQGIERPTMQDVMGGLEFALQLQETADAVKEELNPGGQYVYSEVLSYRAPTYSVIEGYSDPVSSGFTTLVTSSRVSTETRVNNSKSEFESQNH